MPERIEKLRTLLDELEQELHGVETLDEESRSLLKEAADEIQTALEAENVTEIEHDSLTARLNDAVSEFESSHPTIYAVVNRMVDVLGQMGI